MEARTDIELVALARQGDKDAFGLLAQRYQIMAQRFAMRLIPNEQTAQDLMQEAMLQAYLSLDRLREPSRFKSWLCGILLNVCRSHLRDRKIIFFSLEAMIGDMQLHTLPSYGMPVIPEKMAEERELYKSVLDTVDSLSSEDRDMVLLFYYAQLSLQEIAALKGISRGTVKVRLYRARQRLKDKLISKYPEIITREQRREIMVKVTIADVVKQERTDKQGHSHAWYIIVLRDEARKHALPIWVDPFAGQSIATGLGEFSMQRPLTFNFFVSILEAINARVEQVRIATLKGNTFYAIVKMRRGKSVSEVDARPSDALALAVLTGSPVFVAEDVLESAGVDIPQIAKVPPTRNGVESILREIQQELQARLRSPLSQEDIARAKEDLIAAVFGS